MKYAERGEHEVYNVVDSAGKLLVFAIGSSCIGFDPVGSVRRWIKTEIKIVGTPAPAMVLQYNSSVGGTDVMDHTVSCNHPRIRSKRWWFPLLTLFLQSALYNSYLIYWKTPGAGTANFDFLCPVVPCFVWQLCQNPEKPKALW